MTIYPFILRKLIRPHSIIVTILIFSFICILDYIRLNLHFLDSFNFGVLAMVLAYDFVMIYESLIRKNVPILEKLHGRKGFRDSSY